MKRNLQEQKARALAHENRLARLLGGRRVPGSGALGSPGDVRTGRFLVECKTTQQATLRLDVATIEKIAREAAGEGLTPALALELRSIADDYDADWAMVPLRAIVGMLRAAEDEAHSRGVGA